MKTQVTQKFIRNSFKNIICVGYCNIQYLMRKHSPTWYTAGVYGWNADIYLIDCDTVIVTGYRPFGNIRPDYDVMEAYEKTAEYETRKPWNEQDESVFETLVNGFVKSALETA